MNKNEVWEMTHRVLGMDVKVYDIIVAIFISQLVALAFICIFLNKVKEKKFIAGEYLTNGFTNFTDQHNQKVLKIASFKHTSKKLITGLKKGIKEDIICTSCGASLMTTH